MNRWWMTVVVAALVIGCTRFIIVSPDDPTFCQRCSCRVAPPRCPGWSGDTPQCTLRELLEGRASNEELNSNFMAPSLLRCGEVAVFHDRGTDYDGSFAFDIKTGALVASRTGGGYAYQDCGGGYYANYRTFPPGYVFPKPAECSTFDVDATVPCAGTFALCSASGRQEPKALEGGR